MMREITDAEIEAAARALRDLFQADGPLDPTAREIAKAALEAGRHSGAGKVKVRFALKWHSPLPDVQVVEVTDQGGRLLAVIYPDQDGVKIVSKYMGEISRAGSRDSVADVPTALVSFVT